MLTLTCHVFDVSEVFSFRHVTERRGVWDGHIECQYLFITSYDFKVPLKLDFNAWAISKGIQAWRDENMVNT